MTNDTYYIYNNEALASCILLAYLKASSSIDIARVCLVLPFLMDDKTVRYLRNHDLELGGLSQLISYQTGLFSSFNKRYLSLLPITVNSLILLSKSSQIVISSEITSTSSLDVEIIFKSKRLSDIIEAIPKFIQLTHGFNTSHLYQMLKVKL